MKYKKGTLSVLCLGYNHAEFIDQCIESIWNTHYDGIEIIAMDDGSSDNSREILTELQSRSPIPMVTIFQENTGMVGLNLNRCMKKATGEYVTMLSMDDVLISDKIVQSIRFMDLNADHAFIAPSKIKAIYSRGHEGEAVESFKLDGMPNPTTDDLLKLELNEFHSFYVQGTIFRREVVDAVGGFDDDLIGDDIILRTKLFRHIKENPQWKYKIIHEPTACYRRHDGNISRNGRRQLQIVSQYLTRYWPQTPNPPIFLNWFMSVTSSMSFAETLALFTIDQRMASLLLEPAIVEFLRRKGSRERRIFRWIFRKEKNGNNRCIVLFSRIRIHHTKKAQ